MSRISKSILSSLVAGSLFPLAAAASTPGAGIAGTNHDFAGIGNPPTGLCTFCHTPHRAMSQALIWNHTLSSNTFTWSDPATTAGTDYPTLDGDSYKGATVKCLSCHDGTVAVGDVGWWNNGKPTNPLLNETLAGSNYQIAGWQGTTPGDMTGNHPVAMPFPYQQAKNNYNASTTGDNIKLADWVSDPRVNGISLYNDDGSGNISGGAVSGRTGIECPSCHDPHNGTTVQDQYFLRGHMGGNAGGPDGYICLKCHQK